MTRTRLTEADLVEREYVPQETSMKGSHAR
jgi:hypothetical protein